MIRSLDKVIITNRTAMAKKYGQAGLAIIDAALERLIAADGARHLHTEIFHLDDPQHMGTVKAKAVVSETDERGAKAAVDAIAEALKPDYIMLLDGPDVVPHIRLDPITGLNDNDSEIETDFPYACTAPFSRLANSYVAKSIERVVGRLPMAPASTDAEGLARMIDACCSHAPAAPGSLTNFFAISAYIWSVSTKLSLKAVFGNCDNLHLSPDEGHHGINAELRHPIHFINCHGSQAEPFYYGERDDEAPVAMESQHVAPHVGQGAVVVAECCYGALLYHKDYADHPPICMSYLLNGAVAFVGSTTIAYGPAEKNAEADLICQYFLEEVLGGASTGRSLLRARQRFAQSQKLAWPTNLKTLAQFVLYGDPSIQPALSPFETLQTEVAGNDEDVLANDRHGSRKLRRVALKSAGAAIAATTTYIDKEVGIDGNRKALQRFEAVARQRGYIGTPSVYSVSGGRSFRNASKALGRTPQIAIIVEHSDREIAEAKFPRVRVLTAHILGDGITAIEESESR